jgi:hypothetical protein
VTERSSLETGRFSRRSILDGVRPESLPASRHQALRHTPGWLGLNLDGLCKPEVENSRRNEKMSGSIVLKGG